MEKTFGTYFSKIPFYWKPLILTLVALILANLTDQWVRENAVRSWLMSYRPSSQWTDHWIQSLGFFPLHEEAKIQKIFRSLPFQPNPHQEDFWWDSSGRYAIRFPHQLDAPLQIWTRMTRQHKSSFEFTWNFSFFRWDQLEIIESKLQNLPLLPRKQQKVEKKKTLKKDPREIQY